MSLNKVFDVKVKELSHLMELRDREALEEIDKVFGGIDGLCKKLQTDPVNGLPNDNAEIEYRRKIFGRNEIPPTPSKTFLRLAFDALKDFTLIILIICAVVSFLLTEFSEWNKDEKEKANSDSDYVNWLESAAILFAVFVVVLITTLNDWSKEKQFRNLQSQIETKHKFSVVRGGTIIDVIVHELVVGDIGLIKYGDILPADGILIQSNDLKMDESSFTGESDYIKKSVESDPILLSGTNAMEGSGKMIITAVGVNSQTGIIMAFLNSSKSSDLNAPQNTNKLEKKLSSNEIANNNYEKNIKMNASKVSKNNSLTNVQINNEISADNNNIFKSKSVLQGKLSNLAGQIGYIGFIVAAATVIILIGRFCIDQYILNKKITDHVGVKLIGFFITGVTILVIAVPEGLPLAITLALSYSVKKMMKDNNLVRHLDACETMGNATTICSDKTGTLTTNSMSVVQSFINDNFYKIIPKWFDLNEKTRNLLVEGISVNSSYTTKIVLSKTQGQKRLQLGNKTECALLGFVLDLNQNYEEIRKKFPAETLFKVYTFNSIRKSMMTVIKLDNGGYRIYAKGASEIILSRCNFIFGKNGEILKFDKTNCDELIKNVIEPMASDGLRTIGLAFKDIVLNKENENEELFDENIDWDDEENIKLGFTLIAIVGIQDPVRPEVPESIAQCQRAGITVRMVTGDNINTARSIATACGILKPGTDFLALESKEFNQRIRDANGQVNQEKFDKVWPNLRVLARAQPMDKYVLVKGIIASKCSKNREVVAVTGDGTNDAPALKEADVGFAMGITGTDVARESSDIILTDDNFTSIVKAVMWGRNVYDSISKFLQFQLTVNIVAVLIAFIGACYFVESPIRAVQMLWINLIMDTLASLALATESPTNELLNRKPYGRTKSLISRKMVKNIIGHSLYQLTILGIILFFPKLFFNDNEIEKIEKNIGNPNEQYTMLFNAFVLMTLFNEINSRKIHGERNVFKGLFTNKIFCSIWIITLILQILIVTKCGLFFATVPLSITCWLWCIGFGVFELIWAQLILTIPTNILPKFFAFGRGDVKSTPILVTGEYDIPEIRQLYGKEVGGVHPPTNNIRSGQILWFRTLTRLKTQMRVVRAFQSNINSSYPSAIANDLLRQSYRRLQIAKEQQLKRFNHLQKSGPINIENVEKKNKA